jgi:hypothetical protein
VIVDTALVPPTARCYGKDPRLWSGDICVAQGFMLDHSSPSNLPRAAGWVRPRTALPERSLDYVLRNSYRGGRVMKQEGPLAPSTRQARCRKRETFDGARGAWVRGSWSSALLSRTESHPPMDDCDSTGLTHCRPSPLSSPLPVGLHPSEGFTPRADGARGPALDPVSSLSRSTRAVTSLGMTRRCLS